MIECTFDGLNATCRIESEVSVNPTCSLEQLTKAFSDVVRKDVEAMIGKPLGRITNEPKDFRVPDWMRDEEAPFAIKRVIFNDPATVVYWKDGTKTVVKCQDGEAFDPEKGLALCFMKKACGNKGNFNDEFRKHLPKTLDVSRSFERIVKRFFQGADE